MDDTLFCEKCKRTLSIKEFYSSHNLEKYPTGHLNICKKCITMFVDNWETDTFLWILQECDVPWIPEEWNRLLVSYTRGDKKINGTTIIGRYLSKMKLRQYKDYRWEDTELLQQMANARIESAMRKSGYTASEITQAIETGQTQMPEKPAELAATQPEDYFGQDSPQDDINLGLTEDDITYLRLKWGKAYKQSEWVQLEQLYKEMMESYDIQTAGHIDTLKLLCKTSLKCNQLIDLGDIEGYQKMSKVYDSLMKSGRFTAVQNKEAEGDYVDSIGEIVMMCEKEGYIERYYVDSPKDKVDETLVDMKRYTRTLITEESDLSTMLETAIQKNLREDERESNKEEEDIVTEDDITLEDIEKEIKDKDFSDFNDFIDEEEQSDEDILRALGGDN